MPTNLCRNRDSVLGIGTRFGLESLGFDPRWKQDIFLLHTHLDRYWGTIKSMYNVYRDSLQTRLGVDHPSSFTVVMNECSCISSPFCSWQPCDGENFSLIFTSSCVYSTHCQLIYVFHTTAMTFRTRL